MRYLNLLRNVENWHDYFFYKFGITRNDPLVFYLKNNIVAVVPLRLLHTFKEIFFEECYTRHIPEDCLTDVSTVVDIGANAGYFSLYMVSRYPHSRVLAFEPIPRNFELLAQHRERNAAYNLTIVNKAVYGKPGKIRLMYDAADSYTTAASIFDNALGRDEIEVCAMTLPEIFQAYALKEIGLLKLDCEGAEYDILYKCPGEYLEAVRCIALECHSGGMKRENRASIAWFLESLGYTVRGDEGDMLWAWRHDNRQLGKEARSGE